MMWLNASKYESKYHKRIAFSRTLTLSINLGSIFFLSGQGRTLGGVRWEGKGDKNVREWDGRVRERWRARTTKEIS